MFKKIGLHHIPLALAIIAGLYFVPLVILIPLANAMAWFMKELGEAIGRAGGTREAFTKKRGKDYYGRDVPVWEHWDWITPSVAGFILTGFKIDEAIKTLFS